jgi:hypothetical protein
MTPARTHYRRDHYRIALDENVRRLVAEAIRTHCVVHAKAEAARLEDAFPECDMSKEEIARLIVQAARAARVELDDASEKEFRSHYRG